ncbi:uncharacterized protein [Procambarus clarkii]|uniref:uncharacterized protein isoform X2 n=1 Tax=Procambarus clarkii TaxID=6728 RepID=UPI001E677BAE|nr:uncharacterized protein LOC123762622 isoform X2 [Procambarus clarkii]
MAASRPLGRAACCLSNVIRSNAALSSANGPSVACGYCSQHASSASHTCAPTMMPASTHSPTSFHAPAFTHAHESRRRINRRTELDYEELRALQVAGDIALIDVRDPQELQNYGEIPGSLNIPLGKIKVALQLSKDEWEEEFHMEKPDQEDRNLVFYARGPNASSAAVEIAHRLGFKRSRHYIGGWEDYCKQTGRPLKKPQNGFASCDNYYTRNFDQYYL